MHLRPLRVFDKRLARLAAPIFLRKRNISMRINFGTFVRIERHTERYKNHYEN